MPYTKLDNNRIKRVPNKCATDLISTVANFIHMRCTDLRFDNKKEYEENTSGRFLGKSIAPQQIPYNMQMDVDRLCLANALKNFLVSGSDRDAFNVYFCYIEMFIGNYNISRNMIEMLSEYETNGSSLLMKHRDHYAHSVYVFAVGLAIFESNKKFRQIYADFYGFKSAEGFETAHHFLEFWGLASLFHDIGYPFELPFEQLESYFDTQNGKRQENLYMKYDGLNSLWKIDKIIGEKLEEITGEKFVDINDLFAYDIAKKLGETYRIDRLSLMVTLKNKPVSPDCFGYYMDHAYFSAALLFKKLSEISNNRDDLNDTKPYCFEQATIDAMTAIIMHNSLYKFSIAFYKSNMNKPFRAELHPLAYMLMLCDELQCWNRTSYGRNSRKEIHPMDCVLKFSDGSTDAKYIYDIEDKEKINDFIKKYADDPTLKIRAFSDMYVKGKGIKCKFLSDIESIVDTSIVNLSVSYDLREKKHRNSGLSNCSYVNLYNFAIALSARYDCYENDQKISSVDEQMKKFNEMSLEYKLYNIGQANAFDKYLNEIGCFYTDKDVDFEMVKCFTDDDMQKIGPMEHSRWIREHWAMGWRYGNPSSKAEREQLRIHSLMMDYPEDDNEKSIETHIEEHYRALPPDEQDKDTKPMNHMLKLIQQYEGLRIYRVK